MSTAIASGTWRRPPRRDLGRDLAILALATTAHVVVLLALVSGAHWMPQLAEPPVIEAELLDAPTKRAAAPAPAPVASPRNLRAPPTSSPPITVPASPVAKSSGPPAIVAPPGFTARKLVEESDATRESLRGSLGCRHEKVAALTKAEKAACAEADGLRSRTAPMYAAIDPDKKAAFDGDCAKDDDWCLYRVGKGPYPGIFALGKKKKRKGWDD
ncbi:MULTISPECIES: hypothetical protein [unclassified Caulobacter]|uniref:hypothetical protein n=1 Tax=unclassified Caulobacter TaxID=2648921 RepID=UPI0006F6B577|nr:MULTISPECIES: hypothetical protein [unclassified Caulobacter]KQV62270.1 hypothetical protein ASC62_01655 [Caulobacter sp. Root342]KQV63190.1 hypothetical protein ASC70_22570 [Caulobacter sp. Root343]